MKAKFLITIPVFCISILSLSGCNDEKEKGLRQSKDEVEIFNTNYLNRRTYNEDYFYNPNNAYRVLPVNHQSALSSGGASSSKIDEYMEHGYGGLVSNVALGNNYLTSASNWELMQEAIEYGFNEYDMRMVIYDEEYYPSGAARTQTLAATPENENWEAQGLVYFDKLLTKDVPVTIDTKEGHKLIHAFVFNEKTINTINPNNYIDIIANYQEGSTYIPSNDGLLCLLYSKNWYEGTHYQNNLMESRRYIDLLKDAPVKEFIRNTYEKYYEHFSSYFGSNIESFFFDEPSLPGFYFTPTSPTVLDELNPLIEQYPAVNFDDKICEKFIAKYGYNPGPFLPYLFEKTNANEDVRRFRWQYYNLLSEEVEKNWPKQLNDWCKDHNVISTGHFLAEEDISNHPLTLGNYMNMYQNMGIPGIDLTHGSALDAVTIGANVAKQATSVGDFIGKQDFFCEIGQDEGQGANVYDNIASVAVLQAMGINYLVSYYKLAKDEDDILLANSLARINYLIDGNTSEKDIAVFYPIDGIMAEETPYNSSGNRIYTGSWGFNQYVTEISNCYRNITQTLCKNQIDYDIFSNYMIDNSTVKNGKITTPNGETFSTLIIPYTTAIKEATLEKIQSFANSGVKIILQDISKLLSEKKENQTVVNEMLSKIKECPNTISLANKTPSTIIENISKDSKTIKFAIHNPNIIARKQNNIDNTMYMLVNTTGKPQTITMELNETGSEYLSWDIYSGKVNGMCVEIKNGKTYITVTLQPYRVGMYTVGGTYNE